MYNVLITGAGKIGSLIACLLTRSKEYNVHLADINFEGTDVKHLLTAMPDIKTVALDVKDQVAMQTYLQKHEIVAVVSCLPYFLNSYVAKAAKAGRAHYFDLTEDTSVTKVVKELAENAKTAFVPQCGLAPGFVSIVANTLLQEFDECHYAKLRVGALPQRTSNALQYSLTWSTEGLINEYGNPCHAIEGGTDTLVKPLEDLEAIQIEGCAFEAFNTSGGLGSLAELYRDKINTLNYKTMRYPGHCEKIRFLMNDLKLNEDRSILKTILERAIPKTYQDIVIIYVATGGIKQEELREHSYIKKIYPQKIEGIKWSAIQISTASGVCSVLDLILSQEDKYQGLILQESFTLNELLKNRFAQYFA
ncbi:L-lysine dehydrogenase (plasmid) [Legionella adelaidensis]|uniref:L-lysine dehydrogenase n=1 Tax=Legionella adelaidensis TaxID=45056 RepID=A0A0W0R472_9GAMM|nr:saccharopine dehydrogenase C-terminal domain-containing protein [Legionella adelaidensis]KTC65859.1 L-lysine dehydrogenase [Legionella adelaidensis]VEH85289.1 L-lysine dehydrogenase [Legionella adelaidensis]